MSHFFLIPTLKEFKKLTNICQSYSKNKSGTVYVDSQCSSDIFCVRESLMVFQLFSEEEKCWIVKSLEEVEVLNGDNKYWCVECQHHVEAERSVKYIKQPHILTIHIKQFAAGLVCILVCIVPCVTLFVSCI